MHLNTRNVNDAFTSIVGILEEARTMTLERNQTFQGFEITNSRNGKVLRFSNPLTLTYAKPKERVLFNEARDCNPFFHLFESVWMLAGYETVAPLAYYNSNISSYSDNGKVFNGAYGYRWRHAELKRSSPEFFDRKRIDQLDILCHHLQSSNDSRRAVLQMWNVEDDLLKIGGVVIPPDRKVEPTSKDTCCNLSTVFEIVSKDCTPTTEEAKIEIPPSVRYLNMTVFNRSNDLIWGTLGTNYVHFSILQEYMAARLGVEVGQYHQVSANAHVYLDKFNTTWLDNDPWNESKEYPTPHVPLLPQGENVQDFDTECGIFVESNGDSIQDRNYYESSFLRTVVQPMCNAFKYHKNREYEKALELVGTVQDGAWKTTGTAWIEKRQALWKTRKSS